MASLFRIPPPMDEITRARCDEMMQHVEDACSDMLISPNWTLNMQIVDELNQERDPVVVTEVVRILRKKLGSSNVRTLSVGLTLAETLVKNCGVPVHREVASERFMAAVAKIARTYSFKTSRDSMALSDQSLDIIQAWGEAFLPRRREFPIIVDTYHELRAEGLPFSEQYQSDRPPVLDPGGGSLLDRPTSGNPPKSNAGGGSHSRSGSSAGTAQAVGAARSAKGGGSDGGGAAQADNLAELPGLSVSDQEVVATVASCTEMLDQVLKAAESRNEVRNSDVTTEVAEQLKAVSPKLTGIIEEHGEGDPAMLEGLFKAMDAADKALKLYKDVVDGVASVPILPVSSYSAGVGAISRGVGAISMKEPGSGTAAKVRGGGKPVPTLARPPGHSGKSGASSESPEKKESSVDLLSGFELEGTSLGSSKGSSGEAAAAAPSPAVGADLFADFAAPSAAGGGGVSGGTGGNGIVAQVPQEGVVSAGVHVVSEESPQQPHAPTGPSGPPTAADKAQSLLNNLGALYAGGGSGGGGAMNRNAAINAGGQSVIAGPAMPSMGTTTAGSVDGGMMFPGYGAGGVLGAGNVDLMGGGAGLGGGAVVQGGGAGFPEWAGGGDGGGAAVGVGASAGSSPFDGIDAFGASQQQQQQQQPQVAGGNVAVSGNSQGSLVGYQVGSVGAGGVLTGGEEFNLPQQVQGQLQPHQQSQGNVFTGGQGQVQQVQQVVQEHQQQGVQQQQQPQLPLNQVQGQPQQPQLQPQQQQQQQHPGYQTQQSYPPFQPQQQF